MRLSWFEVVGATYDIDKSSDNGTTWESLQEDYASTDLIDADGTSSDLYRIRTHGSSVWNPAIYAESETSVNCCTVFGYLRDTSGSPKEGADVYANTSSSYQFLTDAFYTKDEPVATSSSSTGYWELALPIGLSVVIKIPFANLEETVTIPDQPTAALSSLL
jgi:hypothetical protein